MPKSLSLFNSLFFYLLVGLICFILLYPKLPLIAVAGTFVAVRLEDILIAVMLVIWFFVNFSSIKKFLKLPIFQLFLIFWTIGFLSLLSGFFITYSVTPHLGLLHWLRRIEVMSLFILAAITLKNKFQLKVALVSLFLVNLIIIFYGLGQIYLEFPVVSTSNREFSKGLILKLTPDARVNSTFAGHYDLSFYLTLFLIFLGSLFFYYKKFIYQAIIVGSGLLNFILLGLTATRISFVATLSALAITFWLMGKRLLIGLLILISVFTVAIIPELRHRLVATITVNLLGGGGPKYTPPQNKTNIFTPESNVEDDSRQKQIIQFIKESTRSASEAAINEASLSADIAAGEPINPTELGVYRSTNIRLNVEWPRAIRAFLKNPILGSGYSSVTIATDNDYLRSLSEVGLLGTVSLLGIFIILIKNFLRRFKEQEGIEKFFLISAICSIFAVALIGIFFDVLEASKIASLFWFVLGMSWAISKKYRIHD